MFTPPGANNACHSHPARCKLRLHFRATIAASIVDYNLRSTLKTIVNRNDKLGLRVRYARNKKEIDKLVKEVKDN